MMMKCGVPPTAMLVTMLRPGTSSISTWPLESATKPSCPSLVPVFSLDRIYTRGFGCRSTWVPRGAAWARMSDHLPLVAELELE